MKKIIFAALCLFLGHSLLAQTYKTDPTFTIEGAIVKAPVNSKIYLFYQTDGRKFIDSSLILQNTFHFKGIAADPLFATLAFDHEGVGTKKMLSKYVDEIDMLHFYLHPGIIKLKAVDSISTATFTVSTINKDYDRLKTKLNKADDKRLARLSAKMQRDKLPASGTRYAAFDDSLKLARQPTLKQFIIENPSSYIALVALQQYAGAFPDVSEVRPLFDGLSPSVKTSKAGKEFAILLNSESELAIGKLAPDFVQNDTSGMPVSLSSFRGKYVLVDFWASWCAPCREESPKLVKAYNALKYKNFTILGVSLDGLDTKQAWIKAIADDGLTWSQVSDLKHWDNAIVKQYGINAIPQNLLIAPNGKIIAKNVEINELGKILKERESKP